MKFIILLSLTGVLVSACGSTTNLPSPVIQIEAQFQPYVNQFIQASSTVNKPTIITSLIVQMVPTLDNDQEAGVVGECTTSNGYPTINIGENYWDTVGEDSRQQLFFHELGHCVLGRVHRPDLNNGEDLSIMNPYVMDSAIYEANINQYFYELFWKQDLVSELPLVNPYSYPPTLTPSETTTATSINVTKVSVKSSTTKLHLRCPAGS
jgi:hypothetical protein